MSQLTEQLDLIDKSLTKVSEALENQDPSDFPYPIDEEDKQGEIEFWPEGGMSTADFIDYAADLAIDGETEMIGLILDAGLESIGMPGEGALEIMQKKTLELLDEYEEDADQDRYHVRASDEDFKRSLLYSLEQLKKWVRSL